MFDATDLLALPPLLVTHFEEGADLCTFHAELPRLDPGPCPKCAGRLVGNGTRTNRHRDLPMRGKPVVLVTTRRRFLCRACGCAPIEALPEAFHPTRMMTRRLAARIVALAPSRTFRSISVDFGVDEESVADLLAEAAASRPPPRAPKRLGMDETMLAGRMRGVLVDLGRQTLLDLLTDRKSATFKARLLEFDGLAEVEVVCIDMCGAYKSLAADLMPGARVVVDKWHVQKGANLAMECARKSIRADLPEGDRKLLMHQRHDFLRRASRLDDEARGRLGSWTTRFPLLGQVHAAKESFFAIWDASDAVAAKAAHDEWDGSLAKPAKPFFAGLRTSWRNWEPEILAHFVDGATNAGTEAMNGGIKSINRGGNGHSFETIRMKALARFGPPPSTGGQ